MTDVQSPTELLPGENPNLEQEILDRLGEEWFSSSNWLLAGRTPKELIGTEEEDKVRSILRSLSVAALS